MRLQNHVHKYKRTNIGKKDKPYIVYACTYPLCPHYQRPALLIGKLAECNRCEKPFILSREALQLAEPHCSECTTSRETNA